MEAVIAWEFPVTYGYPVPVVADPDEPVTITSTVVEGNAARALLGASAGADLLVAGSRSR